MKIYRVKLHDDQTSGLQLEVRDRQLAAARQELGDMEQGFHSNQRLLQQSGEDQRRLTTSEASLREQLKQSRAEAQQAQRDSAKHAADAAVARAEMQQSSAVSPLPPPPPLPSPSLACRLHHS